MRTLFSEDWIQTLKAYKTKSCNLSLEITKHRPIFLAVIQRYERNANDLGQAGSSNFMTEIYNRERDLDVVPQESLSQNDEFRAYSGTAFGAFSPAQAHRANGDEFENAGHLGPFQVAKLDIAPPRASVRVEIGHMRRLLEAMGRVKLETPADTAGFGDEWMTWNNRAALKGSESNVERTYWTAYEFWGREGDELVREFGVVDVSHDVFFR